MEKYKNIEETLKSTLVIAQSTAEEVKRNANKEAELIIGKAEAKAEHLIRDSKRQADKIQQEHEEARKSMNLFKVRCKTLLESQLSTFLDADLNEDEEI